MRHRGQKLPVQYTAIRPNECSPKFFLQIHLSFASRALRFGWSRSTAARVLILAFHCLNTFRTRPELLEGVLQIFSGYCALKAHIQWPETQISRTPAKLYLVQFGASWLEAFFEGANRQLSLSKLVSWTMEAEHDQNWALINTIAQRRQDFESLLAKILRCLYVL